MKKLNCILTCFALLFSLNGFAQDVIIQGANYGIAFPGSDEPDTVAFIAAEEPQGEKYLNVVDNNNDEVFMTVDKPPRFPAGEERLWKYLADNMRYPAEVIGRGIHGQVGVKFVVRKTGEITDVQVSRSVHPLLDEEAIRLVKSMPKWIPADYHGQAVSSPRELFILFKAK